MLFYYEKLKVKMQTRVISGERNCIMENQQKS